MFSTVNCVSTVLWFLEDKFLVIYTVRILLGSVLYVCSCETGKRLEYEMGHLQLPNS